MNLPYSEGSAFVLPLRNGGYARGVVARAKDGMLFGYFFGPRLHSAEEATFDGLDPEKALLLRRFGDLGLINGEWSVLGMLPGWDRKSWPMPRFLNRAPGGIRRPYLVEYSDTDPNDLVGRWSVENDDPNLPDDVFAGYGAIEIRLGKMLADTQLNASL